MRASEKAGGETRDRAKRRGGAGDGDSGRADVPESVDSAVLMSACASTQTTQASGYFL